MNSILTTGGAGFIGSNFIRYALRADAALRIVNLDALTYAGSLENLKDLSDHQLQWAHDGKHLRVWRQKLSVIDSHITQGRWEFRAVDEDTDAYGLALDVYEIAKAKGHLQEKERTGGMKIRIHTGQARKTLKKLFQELDIPPWQRTAKILCIEQDVLAVAGVGLNIDLMTQHGPRVLPTFILDNTH